jgi:pimeloyl-ACP methyl ester carboxylesterase
LEHEYEDVVAVVDAIGERVNVLGHSHGALCVLEAALLTSNIHRIVAYEPPPAPVPDGLMDRIQASLDAGDREGAITTFVCDGVRMPPHEFEQWRSSPIFPTRLATVHTIPREFYAVEAYRFEPERFTDLLAPTMMLLGGDSPPFARKNAEYWHETLPNSRIVVLPGQQHIAMDTEPDLFVNTVQNFFLEAG